MKIECKGKLERAVWAATYGAEFVSSVGKRDHWTRAQSAVVAANAAVEALRSVTRRTGEVVSKCG